MGFTFHTGSLTIINHNPNPMQQRQPRPTPKTPQPDPAHPHPHNPIPAPIPPNLPHIPLPITLQSTSPLLTIINLQTNIKIVHQNRKYITIGYVIS